MNPRAGKLLADAQPGQSRLAAGIASAILVALLALAIARTTLNEVPYRLPPLQEAGAYEAQPPSQTIRYCGPLLRVVSAAAILAMAAAWATAGALAGRPLRLGHPLFGLWTALLAVCLFASASQASDRRAGFDTALEQTSFLAVAFLAMQIVRRDWQRRLVVLSVAGLAVMLGLKGIYQIAVEVPDRVAEFLANEDRILAARNMSPGSPEAQMFETRVRESTATGWFGLANIYASLLIPCMLTLAGLAIDKWRAARFDSTGKTNKRGEVPLPLLAAIATGALAVAPLAAWLMTGSMAGIASGIASGAILALLVLRSDWAIRHRRQLLLAAVATLAAGALAMVAAGLLGRHMPHRSLQVRWLYWSASADIVRQSPIEGAGPGNFPDAYLRHRREGAEEGVKNPHNVVVQALTEYGLTGGLVYLALLGFILVKLIGRGTEVSSGTDLPDSKHTSQTPTLPIALAGTFILAIGWRVAVTHYPSTVSLLFDNFVPVVGLGAGLLAAASFGLGGMVGRIRLAETGLACGLVGFALHNLTDFALFQPGAAMIFWLAGGSLAAQKAGREWTLRRPVVMALSIVLLAAGGVTLLAIVRPNWDKSVAITQAAECLAAGRPIETGQRKLRRAVAADPLDAAPAGELAMFYEAHAATSVSLDEAKQLLDQAYTFAHLARLRQPLSPNYEELFLHALASQLDSTISLARWDRAPTESPIQVLGHPNAWQLSRQAEHHYRNGRHEQAERLLKRAIASTDQPGLLLDHLGDVQYRLGRLDEARKSWLEFLQTRLDSMEAWQTLAGSASTLMNHLNSQSSRMHVRLAELAWQAGQPELAMWEVQAALAADAALTPDSLVRLADWEKQRLEMVKVKSESMAR